MVKHSLQEFETAVKHRLDQSGTGSRGGARGFQLKKGPNRLQTDSGGSMSNTRQHVDDSFLVFDMLQTSPQVWEHAWKFDEAHALEGFLIGRRSGLTARTSLWLMAPGLVKFMMPVNPRLA